ncbi:MAG: ankyrin repeat domain-containing protein [Legionellaceae bacterium]
MVLSIDEIISILKEQAESLVHDPIRFFELQIDISQHIADSACCIDKTILEQLMALKIPSIETTNSKKELTTQILSFAQALEASYQASLLHGQGWFIKRMKALGYNADSEGMCYGLSSMALQAFLAEDIETFNERLNRIHELSEHDFKQYELRLMQKDEPLESGILYLETCSDGSLAYTLKKNEGFLTASMSLEELANLGISNLIVPLTDEVIDKLLLPKLKDILNLTSNKGHTDYNYIGLKEKQQHYLREGKVIQAEEIQKNIIDISAFFDGLILHQSPKLFPALLSDNNKTKHQNTEKTLTLTAPASDTYSIVHVASNTGSYSVDELETYLSCLETHLGQHPIGLILSSTGHAMNLNYDPTQKLWLLIDPNHLPGVKYTQTHALAKALLSGYEGSAEGLVMRTALFTTNKHHDALCDAFSTMSQQPQWKALHALSKEKINQTFDIDHISQLSYAIKYNEIDWLKQALDLTQPSETDLRLAAYFNHLEMLNLLIKKRQPPSDLLTTACKDGQYQLVKVLLKKIKPNTSMLKKAYQKGDHKLIRLFMEKYQDNMIKDACDQGDLELLQQIMHSQNFHLSIEQWTTLLTHATEEKTSEILSFLSENEKENLFREGNAVTQVKMIYFFKLEGLRNMVSSFTEDELSSIASSLNTTVEGQYHLLYFFSIIQEDKQANSFKKLPFAVKASLLSELFTMMNEGEDLKSLALTLCGVLNKSELIILCNEHQRKMLQELSSDSQQVITEDYGVSAFKEENQDDKEKIKETRDNNSEYENDQTLGNLIK